MSILAPLARIGLAVSAVALFATGAQAQVVRFIATNGNDANACSASAPCRTLQRGVNATPAGGELKALNSGGYGAGRITRSITISGDGASATFSTITIESAAARVVLRDLILDGNGTAQTGIAILDAAAVHIEGCDIARFRSYGVHLDVADTELFIADTASRENGYSGIYVNGRLANERLTVENSRFENNGFEGMSLEFVAASIAGSSISGNGDGSSGVGVQIYGASAASITGTTVTDNRQAGLYITQAAQLTLQKVLVSKGARGIYVGGATVRIGDSVVTDNNTGIFNNGGTVLSRRNNMIRGNNLNTFGTLTDLAGV
jgi:hypothetical protein